MRAKRLGPIFRAIVIGLSPACDADRDITPLDATTDALVDTQAITEAAPDVAVDSYVDWCEAGAPWLVGGDGCNTYEYIPCGLPDSDTIDDAGVINRCDQFCTGSPDDLCAEVPQVWYDVLIDAGELDAAGLTEGGVLVLCACVGSSGRKPSGLRACAVRGATEVGARLSHAAHLEAASVHAFARLREELSALGAPRALLDATARAADDEVRHAEAMSRVARELGGRDVAVRVRARRRRSVAAIACENAREGCVRELFGALVATWQARHAADPRVRAIMGAIARDETRHAELSLDVARFLHGKLDARSRARVRASYRKAQREVAREASAPCSPDAAQTLGLPSPHVARAMLDALPAFVNQML